VIVTDPSAFLELYDDALPHVYGYLARRCANTATAEDLTAETFMAAVTALHNSRTGGNRIDLNVAWLIGTARHKLIDHWRRTERRKEELAELWDDLVVNDSTDAVIEVIAAHEALAGLAPSHRAVLTLRYLDDLPVGDVATTMGRTVHATEALLTRAKAAFRNHVAHDQPGGPDPALPNPALPGPALPNPGLPGPALKDSR
jgi:RNA polymerase sigma-70 factor (ECF subfamily)